MRELEWNEAQMLGGRIAVSSFVEIQAVLHSHTVAVPTRCYLKETSPPPGCDEVTIEHMLS